MRQRLLVVIASLATASFAATLGDSPLAGAMKNRDKEAVRSLLKQHADVNAPGADGGTALLWAVHWDDLETADALLRAGANARATNRYGVTPLSEACLNGNAAMIELLLKAGADPNSAIEEGETALMTAARSGNVDAVKTLTAHGADVNAQEAWRGQTALMWAVGEGHLPVVQLLIGLKADVNARSKVFDYEELRPRAGSVPMIWPRGGFTPLLFAARQGDLEAARTLLDAGASIDLSDPDQTTPLVIAIINAHYDLAAFLLQRGANVNIVDTKRGRSALYAAVDMHTLDWSVRPLPRSPDKLDSLDLVKLLLDHGANVNARLTAMVRGRGPLDPPAAVLGPGSTPFMRAAKAGDTVVMRLLLEHGADPTLATKNNTTALMVASGLGYVDLRSKGTEEEAIEAIKICLEHGADINAANDKGETPLHGAAIRGADKVVQFLATGGAKLDVKDKSGHTPLEAANGIGGELGFPRLVHDSTVALLRQLMKNSPAETAQTVSTP